MMKKILLFFTCIATLLFSEVKFSRDHTGKYEAFYITLSQNIDESLVKFKRDHSGNVIGYVVELLDDTLYFDTWISDIDSNSMIRYNSEKDKWEYTNDGTNWVEFGDMEKAIYDTDDDSIVDNSEKLEGKTKSEIKIEFNDTFATDTDVSYKMDKSTFDANDNSIVDKAEGLTENTVTETTIVDGTITETDLSFSPVKVGDNVSLLNNDAGYLTEETDPLSLHLDQTSPQTIVNGVPLLNTTPNGSPDIKSFVNKEYVDKAMTSLGASYYMYRDTDATGYRTCHLKPSTNTETSIIVSGLNDNDYIGGWVSATGEAPQKLLKGVYDWYIAMERTDGNKTLRVYWKLYERTAGDTEIEIATSSVSNEITSKAYYMVPLQLDEDYIPASDSRIVGKLYADVSGVGNAPEITIYFEGSTSSRWEIPANTEILKNIFIPYSGATQNIDLGSKNLTTTGTINAGNLQVNSVDVLTKNSIVITLPYYLWRNALGSEFTGYVDCQIQIATTKDFSSIETSLDSGTSQTNWIYFSATSSNYEDWSASGIEATDILEISYDGDLSLTSGVKYVRGRLYEHGTSNYGTWIPLGVLK